MRAQRFRPNALILAAVASSIGGVAQNHLAHAAVKYTWNNSAGGNWGTSTIWNVVTGQLAYPKNKDAYAQFTLLTTGSQNTSINVTDAQAYFMLFDLGAGNTISSSNGTNALNLVAFGLTANDNVNGVNYGAGVTAIQVKGTGTDAISAPININLASATSTTTGFTIDQQDTAGAFTISGNVNNNINTITPGKLPLTVTGAGVTNISGAVSNVSTINKSGNGQLNVKNTLDAATFNVTAGKIIVDLKPGGNQLMTTSASIVKSGNGILTIYTSNSFTSGQTVNVNGGTLETAGNALGSAALVVNSGGEYCITNGTTLSANNAVTLAGGILSGDNSSANAIAGPVAVTTNSNVRLGDFYQNVGRDLTISGALSGSSNLTIVGPAGAGSLTGQTLALTNASNSGYIGTIQPTNATGYYNLVVNSALGTGGKVLANSTATKLASVVLNANGTSADFSVTIGKTTGYTGSDGGVLLYNGALLTQPIDQSQIGDGFWFFGAPSSGQFTGVTSANGSYWGTSLTPGAGSTYRLGAGGGFLFLGHGVLQGANNVLIGDPRAPSTGGVTFGDAMTYSGTTTIENGTLKVGAANATSPGSAVTFGTATTAGVLDLNGNNTTVGGLSVATGATAANQIVTNNSSTADAILTVNTTAASSTFAGLIKNGASKNLGLVVQGGNVLTLAGNNTYSGTTTINSGTLRLNGTHTGAGTYTIANGAILAGTGSTDAAITVQPGGAIAPGASVGALSVNGFTLQSGGAGTDGSLTAEIDFAAQTADQVLSTGAVDVASGDLNLQFLNVTGTPQFNPTLKFIVVHITSASPLASDPSTIFKRVIPSTSDVIACNVSVVAADGDGQLNDVQVEFLSVPEPASTGFLVPVTIALSLQRRKKPASTSLLV